MKVSVITPCFNEVNTVEALLDNMFKDNSCEKEIIIIDDFSTDGTRKVLQNIDGIKY